MSYIDGFVVPLPKGKEDDYRKLAETFAGKAAELGALGTVEALSDDVPRGKVTDFYRAVQAGDNENVVFSFIVWPDKATRDSAWQKMMSDPEMQPDPGNTPFDGKRMFWGGFEPILDTLGK